MFNSPAQIHQYIFKIRYKLIKSFFLLKYEKQKSPSANAKGLELSGSPDRTIIGLFV